MVLVCFEPLEYPPPNFQTRLPEVLVRGSPRGFKFTDREWPVQAAPVRAIPDGEPQPEPG